MKLSVLNGVDAYNQVFNAPAYLNGVSRVQPPMQGVSRITPMQGYEPQPLGMSNEDYQLYMLAVDLYDPEAINGLKEWREKRRRKKAARKAKRQDRKNRTQERRTNRHELRKENRALKLQRRKDGTRFIDKLGGAVQDYGGAAKIASEMGLDLEDIGIDADPGLLESMAMDYGGDLIASGLKKGGANWWEANKSWALPAGIGVGVLGAFALYKMSTKKKGRRR